MNTIPKAYLKKDGWYSCYCEDGTFLGSAATAAEALEVYGCTVYTAPKRYGDGMLPDTEASIKDLMRILKTVIGRQVAKGMSDREAVAAVTRYITNEYPVFAETLLRLLESKHPSVNLND